MDLAPALSPQASTASPDVDMEIIEVVDDDLAVAGSSSSQSLVSSTSQNPRRRRARRNLICAVCVEERQAAGIHFGCAACAACAAFFRRSVALQRVYICTCIQGSSTPNTNCKFCRFQRCVKSGMRENEVQEKRNGSSEPIRPAVPRDVVPREYYQVEMTVLDEAMTLTRNALSERHNAFTRLKIQDQYWPRQSFAQGQVCIEVTERPIFMRFLNNSHLGKCIDDIDFESVAKEIFLLWINIEETKTTMRCGGVQLNRAVQLDETYLEVDERSMEAYLNTCPVPVKDVDKIARLILPVFIHHTRTVSRTMQAARLSELELVAIFQLTAFYALPSCASESTRQKMFDLRTKVMKELTAHYESVHIPALTRLDSLMHIISILREQLFMTRELIFYLIVAGQGGDLRLSKMDIYLHISDFGTLIRKNFELAAWKQAIQEREISRTLSRQQTTTTDSRESTPTASSSCSSGDEALSVASQFFAESSS